MLLKSDFDPYPDSSVHQSVAACILHTNLWHPASASGLSPWSDFGQCLASLWTSMQKRTSSLSNMWSSLKHPIQQTGWSYQHCIFFGKKKKKATNKQTKAREVHGSICIDKQMNMIHLNHFVLIRVDFKCLFRDCHMLCLLLQLVRGTAWPAGLHPLPVAMVTSYPGLCQGLG